MRFFFCALSILVVLAGCGYRFQDREGSEGPVTVSIPSIRGDTEGRLKAELIRLLSNDPHFEYQQDGGAILLELTVTNDGSERIGYRYDRNPSTGERRKNIVGTENRRNLSVEVTLIDSYTQKVILSPVCIEARADYDYIDSNSIRDLTFTNSLGKTQTVINFSLGQLDSIEGAYDDSTVLIYRQLAQKIIDGISSHGW